MGLNAPGLISFPIPTEVGPARFISQGERANVGAENAAAESQEIASVSTLNCSRPAARRPSPHSILWDKVLVDFGLKKSEAAVLAEQGQQGDLLRQMTRMISQRVFWTERYSGEAAFGFPSADLDEAWKRYNDSVVVWNENYMLNVMLTEKYFNEESKKQLADLNWMLRGVNSCLNRIHYPQLYKDKDAACHVGGADGGSEGDNLRVLQESVAAGRSKVWRARGAARQIGHPPGLRRRDLFPRGPAAGLRAATTR